LKGIEFAGILFARGGRGAPSRYEAPSKGDSGGGEKGGGPTTVYLLSPGGERKERPVNV